MTPASRDFCFSVSSAVVVSGRVDTTADMSLSPRLDWIVGSQIVALRKAADLDDIRYVIYHQTTRTKCWPLPTFNDAPQQAAHQFALTREKCRFPINDKALMRLSSEVCLPPGTASPLAVSIKSSLIFFLIYHIPYFTPCETGQAGPDLRPR
jgi:hypothetical protein